MAKTESEAKGYSSTGLSVVLIILCLVAIAGFFVVEFVLPDKDYEYSKLSNEYASLENEVLSQNEEIASLNSELETINSIGESIEKEKNEFFENAKIVEEKVMNDELDVNIAYLTFDDGPYLEGTPMVMDILKEYDILGTFFILEKGEDYLGYNFLPVIQRMIDEGHTVGNHTASHSLGAGGIYSSTEAFLSDIQRNRDFIYENFGYTTTVMRFPGGIGTAGSLGSSIVEGLRNMDPPYAYAQWNAATGDGSAGTYAAEENGVEIYTNNVLETTCNQDVSVVLMHDYSRTTIAALPGIIEGLIDQGYIFLPLFYDSIGVHR